MPSALVFIRMLDLFPSLKPMIEKQPGELATKDLISVDRKEVEKFTLKMDELNTKLQLNNAAKLPESISFRWKSW